MVPATISVGQALAIDQRQPTGPLTTASLRPKPSELPTSLRSFVANVAQRQVLMFLEVRSPDLLGRVGSIDELRQVWPSRTVDHPTLVALQNALSSAGGQLVYLSRDQKTVGIRGSISALTTLGALRLQKDNPQKEVNDALSTIGQGAGAAGAAAVALAGAAAAGVGGVAEVFVVLGSFAVFGAAGFVLGAGIAGLLAATAATAETTVPPQSSPPPDAGPGDGGLMSGYQIFGQVPDQMSAELVDAIFQYVFGVDPPIPEPGQLPGAGDLAPGDGGTGGGFGDPGGIGEG